jgi:cation transport regulator ChaB
MMFKVEELLPLALQETMPEEAKKIYVESYNESWQSYDANEHTGMQGRETVAHRDAWSAVKREFVHDEKRGIWYRHGEAPEESGDKGIVGKLKDLIQT